MVIPASLVEFVFVYLYDLLACSTFSSHLCLLEKITKCLCDSKLTINIEIANFALRRLDDRRRLKTISEVEAKHQYSHTLTLFDAFTYRVMHRRI